MATPILTRWLAPAVFAAGLGLGALTPATAQARDDELVRVLVNVADVVINGGYPYFRYGPHYGYDNRLVVVYDRYRRPTYYRYVPRRVYVAAPPPRVYYRSPPAYHRPAGYYDPRYGYRDRHDRHDRRYDRNRGRRDGY